MNSRAVKRAASVIELAQGKHKKLVIMLKTDVKEGAHPGFENIRPYTSGASAISSVDPDARVPAGPASLPAPRPCPPRVPCCRTQVSPSYDEPLGSCTTPTDVFMGQQDNLPAL